MQKKTILMWKKIALDDSVLKNFFINWDLNLLRFIEFFEFSKITCKIYGKTSDLNFNFFKKKMHDFV